MKPPKKISKRSKLSGGLGRETFDQSENETRIWIHVTRIRRPSPLPSLSIYPFPLPTTHPIQCWKGLYQGLHGFNPVGGVVRGTGRVQSGGAESLQLRLSLEFEFHLQFPWGSPSTELSDFRRSARYGNEREYKKPWKKRAKGNDVITYVLSADQHTPLAHLP